MGLYPPLPLGTALKDGRYPVERVLEEEVFTITYLGFDRLRERKVMIKEYYSGDRMSRDSADSTAVLALDGAVGLLEAGRERFLREAKALARSDMPPRIAGACDCFQENNTAYMVLEYMEGIPLAELTARAGGKVPWSGLGSLLDPLFPALHEMHRQGVVHWDIRPGSLLVDGTGVILTGFGWSPAAYCAMTTMPFRLTHGYAPVELYQRRGRQGPWTDVYGLSATIYFSLTGTKPPMAPDRLIGDGLVPPRELGADLTAGQEEALLRGMGIFPGERLQSMEELRAALYENPGPPRPGFWRRLWGSEIKDAKRSEYDYNKSVRREGEPVGK